MVAKAEKRRKKTHNGLNEQNMRPAFAPSLPLPRHTPLAATTSTRAMPLSPAAQTIRAVVAGGAEALPPLVAVPDTYLARTKHNLASLAEYESLYAESVADPGRFWADVASEFYWSKWAPEKHMLAGNFDVTEGRVETVFARGCETNISYNCLDRNVERGLGGTPAVLAEPNGIGDERVVVSYAEMLEKVQVFAAVLRKKGVRKGDVVTVYMPMVAELPVAMLACARIGAVHSVVFGGFSAESLAGRMKGAGSRFLVTCDGVFRGEKLIKLKDVADKAVAIAGGVDSVLVLERVGRDVAAVKMGVIDAWWHDAVDEVRKEGFDDKVEWVDSEHPLFILYTSGSTGQPKGIQHGTGGYMIYTATTFKYTFNHQPGDVFFCTADCGWITGHSYVTYGPMLNGATQVVFEGIPTYPDAGRLWDITDRYGVTALYTAPTAVRALKRAGDDFVTRYSRASLKILGSVGEPINPEAYMWYFNVVGGGRCPIVDTWWQTETGGFCLTPLPVKGLEMKPGSAMMPFLGIEPAILNEAGEEVEGEGEGYLVIKKPWPSTLRSIYGDHKRMENVYFSRFPGYYMTGDGARRDKDGHYSLTGRVDGTRFIAS